MRSQIFNHPQRSVTRLTWRLEKWFCELGSRWDRLSRWLASRRNPSTFCLQLLPFGGSCLLRQSGKRNDCGSRHWLELVRKGCFFFFLTLPISLFPGKLGRIFCGCGVHTMSLLPEGVSSAKVSLSMLRRLMTVESPCCNYMTGLNKPTIRVPLPGIYDLVINTVKRKVWNAQINTLLQNYRFLLYFRFL